MGAILDDLLRASSEDARMAHVETVPGDTGLTSRLPVGDFALDAVRFFAAQAARHLGLASIRVDPRRVGLNFVSTFALRIDDTPVDVWAPLSGFFPARDGWVRTHGNYPHHRVRLSAALGLSADAARDDVAAAIAERSAGACEEVATAHGALCVRVRTPDEYARAIRPTPMLEMTRASAARRNPGEQLRVLDLSRVIAGPTATRALALVGADVLRLDPPGMPEIDEQHIDTGAGKRTASLDLTVDLPRFRELLDGADVLVLGYRAGSLDRFGLSAEELAETRPHLVVASLTAYPAVSAWALRRGFDSLVQAASGIAYLEGESVDGMLVKPGALRAQALDHVAGYVLAGAVLGMVAGGTGGRVRTSLSACAHALLSLGDAEQSEARLPLSELRATDPAFASHFETIDSGYGRLTRVRSIVDIPGHEQGGVDRLGSARPTWL